MLCHLTFEGKISLPENGEEQMQHSCVRWCSQMWWSAKMLSFPKMLCHSLKRNCKTYYLDKYWSFLKHGVLANLLLSHFYSSLALLHYFFRQMFPLFLCMIADIRKYVIWKLKLQIRIPTRGEWCLCKSHEKSYWICKTLRNNATLNAAVTLFVCYGKGKRNDINFAALLFFTPPCCWAFSFRSLTSKASLFI